MTAVLALALTLLGGCWSSREINTLAFIMAVGLDQEETGDLVVSFRIAEPAALATTGEQGGTPGTDETTFPIVVRAKTVAEAMERLRTQLPRQPFLSHSQGIIIGESLARAGVNAILDFFERDEELRRSVHLFVTQEVDAAEIFTRVKQRLRTPSGIGFSELITHVAEAGFIPVARFGDFLEHMGNPRREAFAPALTLRPADVTGDAPPDQAAIAGTAIFKDDKLVGFLDPNDSTTLQLILGGIRQTIIPVGDNVKADLRVSPAGTRIRVVDAAAAKFQIQVRVRAALDQLHTIGVVEGGDLIDELSRDLEKELKRRVEKLIATLKIFQSDVIGFGEALYRAYPQVWKQVQSTWPDVFVKADIDVSVQGVTTETGSILRSLDVSNKRPGGDDPTLARPDRARNAGATR